MPITLHGTAQPAYANLPHALATAILTPAALLLHLGGSAESAIAAATSFAEAHTTGEEALVVNILYAHPAGDWPAARDAALLWAFTRHAALAWAPRRIRVNALGLGISPLAQDQPRESAGRAASPAPAAPASCVDIAATIAAMLRWPSMTGQLIRLGAA